MIADRLDSVDARGCRLCGSTRIEQILDLGRMPIAHRMLEQADAPEERFAFSVWTCLACGHAQVVDPIPPAILYSGFNYNFSSWKAEPHFAHEIETVIATAAPTSVLDVGANDGRWLAALRESGVARVVGVEPNPAPGAVMRERDIPLHAAMFDMSSAAALREKFGRFDLVSARQVMEHVENLDDFLAAARSLVRDDGWLFIDVPDFGPARAAGDCSVLWEEHISYFTLPTLEALLRRAGFIPQFVERYNFSGGTVAILARRAAHLGALVAPESASADAAENVRFGARSVAYGERLARALDRSRAAGARTVLYGVGVRACTATNGLDLGNRFELALDDQPERQGKFMPGSRLPIRSPQALAGTREPVVCVLAVNNENEAAVKTRFSSIVGAPVTFVSPCAPADIWAELERLEQATWN